MVHRKRTVVLLILVVMLFSAVSSVAAQTNEPATIGSAYFVPSSIATGGSTTLNIDNLKAASATTTVGLCFYYSDSGMDSLFPASVTGTRSTTYTRGYQGLDSAAVTCPSMGSGRITEYAGTPNAFAKLLGENVDFAGTVSSANGVYPVDILQLEDLVLTDGFSTSLTIAAAATDVYVSNDTACGGNAPCYSGTTALQQAFTNVADNGTVFIYGTYSQGGGVVAALTGSKSVTVSGFNSPIIENGGGTCSGAMIENQSSGFLIFSTVTLDGTCAVGSRSAGILQSGVGTTIVQDSFMTIRDFVAVGSSALRVSNGLLIARGNGFQNNQKAFDQTGGTLYAFANNINTNLGANAATKSAGTSNVTCNYWSASTISGFGTDFTERLGAPMVSYNEGSGTLTLDAASLAANGGTQVIVGMGRVNNPFGNGTVEGLGARVSDYYAACGTGATALSGLITIVGDSVTPGPTGFRLYSITNPLECSPASNTACWDYQNVSCTTAGCSVTGSVARDGHFMVGNEVDPTAVSLQSFGQQSGVMLWPVAVLLALMAGMTFVAVRRRRA